jgi:hypothetical protein
MRWSPDPLPIATTGRNVLIADSIGPAVLMIGTIAGTDSIGPIVLTNRPPEHGIRDYDVFYFDADVSWNGEDAVIRRAGDVFAGVDIEIRNQARSHLWYSEKFGMPYPPLTRATDGIDRFLMHNAQVGIRAKAETYEIYAPRGFGDLADMIVRPNRTANFRADLYYAKAERWKALWPEIRILPA